jgi:hypothetical protein
MFSAKELEMIRRLSSDWSALIKKDVKSISPVTILENIGMECFLSKKEGQEVDSLRRCLLAIQKGNPYRGTPEYEALIDLEKKAVSVYWIKENPKNRMLCPLCDSNLEYTMLGEVCPKAECPYVDGMARLTEKEALIHKEKLLD